MPFALVLIGFLIMVAAIRDELGTLGALLKSDFSGAGNFLFWLIALILIGSIGYFSPLTKTSRALLALILVVMVLSDKGFFEQFTSALANTPAPPPAGEKAVGTSLNDSGGAGAGGGSSGGSSGSKTGAEIGAVAGTFLPIPGGSAIGSALGSAIGGIF